MAEPAADRSSRPRARGGRSRPGTGLAAAAAALFVPATRPDRVAKAAASGTDVVIVDLEDAVAPAAKGEARSLARQACHDLASTAPDLAVLVRVNAEVDLLSADVAAALVPTLTGLVVPKVAAASDLLRVRALLVDHDLEHLALVAGIESGRGVLAVEDIAACGEASALYFGAEDLVVDLGGVRTLEGREVLYARSRTVLAARVHGLAAFDQIVPAYRDDERFLADAAEGRALGFTGKLCIHPRQVGLAARAFRPSAEELEQARTVVDAYESAVDQGQGAASVDGELVDQPMLTRARAVLARRVR